MSIRQKLLLALVPTILILFGGSVVWVYESSKRTVLTQIHREMFEVVRTRAREFDVLFESSRSVADALAVSLGTRQQLTREEVEALIRATLDRNPAIFGSAVALDPRATELGLYGPYFCRSGGEYRYQALEDPAYDYPAWEWYREPLRRQAGCWSEPYLDTGGGRVLMTTYSTPIFQAGRLIGVATVDISLAELLQRLRQKSLQSAGYSFIVTPGGRMVAHPRFGLLSEKTIHETAAGSLDESLQRLLGTLRSPGTDFVEMADPFERFKALIIDTDIQSTRWTLVLVTPSREILQPLLLMKDQMLLVSGLAVALVMALVLWISSSVTAPLARLVKQTDRYAKGDFTETLEEGGGSLETRRLAKSFNRMGESIQEQMENVRRSTLQTEHYQHELQIAAQIQQTILPRQFPPFPDLETRMDLFGLMKPAKEVAGDFFDFIRLPGDRIGLAVGDVSDKGAPAALFMAMARTLVRETAERGYSPAELVRRVNWSLCKDNEPGMFVTLLYAEYQVLSGHLRFVCAGHPFPLVREPDGRCRVLSLESQLPLGIAPGRHYTVSEASLAPGETLLFFTDGVTEAMNQADELFGLARLEQAFGPGGSGDLKNSANGILAAVEQFGGTRANQDDITMLFLRRPAEPHPGEHGESTVLEHAIRLELPARTEVLGMVASVAEMVGRDCGFSKNEVFQITLALDEVVANVVMHAYPADSAEFFHLDFLPRTDGLCIQVSDYGKSFDFAQKVDRYKGQASLEQPVGGIGLFLAKESMDEIWYEPETLDGNRVVMVKKHQPSKGEPPADETN